MRRALLRWLGREPEAAGSLLERLSAEDFVVLCYEMLFDRSPDLQGLQTHLRMLSSGVSRRRLVAMLLECDEFQNRLLGVNPLESLHRARVSFVQSLPEARRIVDLGGASRDGVQGALYIMGYPHRAEELFIIDLPPEARLDQPGYQPVDRVEFEGTAIRYLYTPMKDLSAFDDDSVDLVFSGESIEHVPEPEAVAVMAEAFRILRPGGSLCLDTPNGRLTRLQSPDALIHPEHHKEYTWPELAAMVTGAGFEIVESGGICPMRRSVESQTFRLQEMAEAPRLDPDPEVCYLLFVKARKPGLESEEPAGS